MTQIKLSKIKNYSSLPDRLTFEEYRFYENPTDTRYELDRGQLIPMPTATALHSRICQFLLYCLQQYLGKTDLNLVAVSEVGVRTGVDSSRIPDLVVCGTKLWEELCDRQGSGILDLDEIPNLVVEVTSENWREDYILKRAEYALINVPEYWIVDPNKKRVRILTNPEGEDGYEHQQFQLEQRIKSLLFPDLELSVQEILCPPIIEDLIRVEQGKFTQLQQQVEDERQRAETERQRAEKLAALLQEQGINPEQLM